MKTVSTTKVVSAQEAVEEPLPPRIQEALGQLVEVAKEGLLALSVGVGLGVLQEMMAEEVVGPQPHLLIASLGPHPRPLHRNTATAERHRPLIGPVPIRGAARVSRCTSAAAEGRRRLSADKSRERRGGKTTLSAGTARPASAPARTSKPGSQLPRNARLTQLDQPFTGCRQLDDLAGPRCEPVEQRSATGVPNADPHDDRGWPPEDDLVGEVLVFGDQHSATVNCVLPELRV